MASAGKATRSMDPTGFEIMCAEWLRTSGASFRRLCVLMRGPLPGARPIGHCHSKSAQCRTTRYVSAFAILYSIYFSTVDDVTERFPDVDDAIPVYIYTALVTTTAIFSSFTLTQVVWMWRKPRDYWCALPPVPWPHARAQTSSRCVSVRRMTEPLYALLSLTAKASLGLILVSNLLLRNAQEGSAGG